MVRVDSTTLLTLVGIVGTVLGTTVGAGCVIGAARVTSRGQAEVEEQRARRQAYGACATVLLARRDAANALLVAFSHDDDFDPAAAQARTQDLDDKRVILARAVGAVAVDGPYTVASSAEAAAYAIEELAGRLRDWVTSVAGARKTVKSWSLVRGSSGARTNVLLSRWWTTLPLSTARCCTPARSSSSRGAAETQATAWAVILDDRLAWLAD
jgi:hypothetical protein